MSQPAQTRSVIVSGARTPMGRLLGSLKDFSAADLGGVAIKAALERAGITGDQVDYVIMGHVIPAGAGQNPARPAAVAGGIPMTVPSFTLNKVCLSGLDAIALADQLIRAGEFEIVVAGDRKSTRLNSSHANISYAVFCLKKKKHPHNASDADTMNHTTTHSEII